MIPAQETAAPVGAHGSVECRIDSGAESNRRKGMPGQSNDFAAGTAAVPGGRTLISPGKRRQTFV
jgi:hypothetical protein